MKGFLLVRSLGSPYGLPIESVLEVVDGVITVPVPTRVRAVRGVSTVRGRTMTVAHLGALLTDTEPDPEVSPTVVLVQTAGRPVAIEVDDAEAVVRDARVRTSDGRGGWLLGVAERADGTVPIVDPRAIERRLDDVGDG